jgi:hypothetical protein
LGSALILPQSGNAANRVTTDTGWKGASGAALYNMASGYGKVGSLAAVACGASTDAGSTALGWISYVKGWGIGLSLFAGAVYGVEWKLFSYFSGMNTCTIAKQAAAASYWAGYHWVRRHTIWIRVYVWQEDRTLLPDKCHSYVYIDDQGWVISNMVHVVLPGSGGCP